MKCFVCEKGNFESFFVKDYGDRGGHTFVKCDKCGLVINKSVYDMSIDE